MKTKGMIYAASAAMFWAISGISGQILFQKFSFTVHWLVSARMLVSAFVLILISQGRHKENRFAILKKPKDALTLILFGIFGMYAVQASFFQTIALSNASFATIIQFTGPVFIIFYEAFRQKRWPSIQIIFLLLMIFIGILLITTHGNLHHLFVPKKAIIMGGIAALAIAAYSILPRQLISTYGSLSVVGWGMVIGGTFANLIHPIWYSTGTITPFSVSQILIVSLVGTALSFYCYSQSLRYISPSLAGILIAVEPLLSLVFSIIIFQMSLGWIEWGGFVMVLYSILLIQKQL